MVSIYILIFWELQNLITLKLYRRLKYHLKLITYFINNGQLFYCCEGSVQYALMHFILIYTKKGACLVEVGNLLRNVATFGLSNMSYFILFLANWTQRAQINDATVQLLFLAQSALPNFRNGDLQW